MSLLDVLAALVIYVAVYWLLGPLLLVRRDSDYMSVVGGLHALTAITMAAVGIVLSIEGAIRQLL